ncbi:MAG: RHS repeat-associated core domain-containing protein [Dehalococcoidia bacterium]|nr:RHS repeat-associated core domain-containing protein [Dehalococcoidia bacterium]
MTDTLGNVTGSITYEAYGETASGDVATDIKFTGQRLDETGLYFYNARYYDATIGRFISPDTIVPNPTNPQEFNRYSYCLNNPLLYTDPSGYQYDWYMAMMVLGQAAQAQESGESWADAYLANLAAAYAIQQAQQWSSDQIAAQYIVDSNIDTLSLAKAAIGYEIEKETTRLLTPSSYSLSSFFLGSLIPFAPNSLYHIFRDTTGHFAYDTPLNRWIIQRIGGNSANFQGTDIFGKNWYSKVYGRYQIWVEINKGQITNAGINVDVQWRMNPSTGRWQQCPGSGANINMRRSMTMELLKTQKGGVLTSRLKWWEQ